MSPGFSTDFKEQVRSRTNLVELVGETVALTPLRGGSDYVGLCPFHDDRNPSFHVYPDRQTYRCWSCQEGGDCFSFMMKIEGVGFREALEGLARRASLELPASSRDRSSRPPRSDGLDKQQLLEVLAWAETEFHQFLLQAPQAAPARDYLAGRGFTRDTLQTFRIGCHPADWQWLLERARGKYSAEQLLAARLVARKNQGDGRPYDLFRNRVLFPIRDERGRPVAFGGRVLPGDPSPAKYWNSPESELFSKSRLLYGMDQARDAIRRSETVVVVEGYTDCMMIHQHGLKNVVATLGTALTETHVTGLKRFARKVVLVFDGDGAGQDATERSLVKFLAHELDLRILTLPGGQDPPEFLAAHGFDAFRTHIEQAPEVWEYKLARTIERFGLDTIDARHQVLKEMLELLAQAAGLAGTERENIILSKLAHRVVLSEQIVRDQLKQIRQGNRARPAATARAAGPVRPPVVFFNGPDGKPDKHDLLECELLEIVFTAPEHVGAVRRQIGVEDFRNPHLRGLLQLCYDLDERGTAPSHERLMAALEDPDQKRLAARLDEMARETEIARKLRERDPSRPGLLQEVIDQLVWRRQARSHERSRVQIAQATGPASGLDSSDKELLRLLSQYHQQRANRKTST